MAKTKVKPINRLAEMSENGFSEEINEREVKSAVMDLQVRVFTIEGISPLLHNNPAEFIGKNDEGLTGKKQYDDEEEARLRVYLDADENYAHPSESFPKAMGRAVSGKKFGKVFATQIIKSAVFASEPYCKILGTDGKPIKKYSIDRRGVVIGKSRVLRCRPSFWPWKMKIALEIDMAVVGEQQIMEALSLAGRFPGIGDYRPEKGGAFGRFKVIK